ncbi:hypothetical protein M595_0151 [Lyngbya aestuarii BL J]|uniref:Uncharacterized protein n=1 Tax=Lyngbya aestuarii BL J TaxID=1348334 RepID=U7QSD1_9CYAN|nr:hypothetical protein M595_0151 [Lyngbya aestuarii BL J]
MISLVRGTSAYLNTQNLINLTQLTLNFAIAFNKKSLIVRQVNKPEIIGNFL